MNEEGMAEEVTNRCTSLNERAMLGGLITQKRLQKKRKSIDRYVV